MSAAHSQLYGIKVKIRLPDHSCHWQWLHASGSRIPYQYATYEEAEQMARLCYDADPTTVRVMRFPASPFREPLL